MRTFGRTALLLAALATPCAAETKNGGSPYKLKWRYDAPIIGVSGAMSLGALIGYPRATCLPNCVPPPGLLPFDRGAVGNYSAGAREVADAMIVGILTAPLIVNMFDSRMKGWLEDTTVMLETVLAVQGTTQLTKSAFDRVAPLAYNPSAPQSDLESPDASRSFISGHTATAFAAATAYSYTFWKRHPKSPWRFVVLAASESLALAIGMLKVKAGYHYPTDIAAGAMVGASFGLLIPALHSEW